jgi:hypothetical protein
MRHYDSVQRWIRVWNYYPGVPILLFLILVYIIAGLVVFGQVCDQASDGHWIFCRFAVGTLAIVNLICIGIGRLAVRWMRLSLSELETNYLIAKDIEKIT